MKTKSNKIAKNTTRKNISIKSSLKILKTGYPLYASKQYEGSTILEYNKSEELKYHDKCLMQNSSWFGDLNVAKSYKTKDTHIYRWTAKKVTKLLNINSFNESFIDNIFKKSKAKLIPTISLTKEQINKIKYEHSYLNMSPNEKALYEFKFCFGFITVKEQYEFMKFVEYLIENKITDIKRRNGKSILNKLIIKIRYYELSESFNKKEKMNRISFYDFDKHAIMNFCKVVHKNNIDIEGVFQRNEKSFWFPNLIIYKMDIQEYILFGPQDCLVYDKKIE
jgi:hypothetical protein